MAARTYVVRVVCSAHRTIVSCSIVGVVTIDVIVLNAYGMRISDANDAELLNAEPRLLVIDAEPRFSFSDKKTSSNPNRVDTLGN